MSIVFYSDGNKNLASARIRVTTFVEYFQNAMVDAKFTLNINDISQNDIVIVPKTHNKIAVSAIRQKCKTLIWDVCDNYFADRRRNDALYMLNVCDGIICTTETMKDVIIKENASKEVDIVEDPVYYQFKTPSFMKDESQLNLLWYGNNFNLDHADWDSLVFDPIEKIKSLLPPIKFTFLSNGSTLPVGYNKVNGCGEIWSVNKQEVLSNKADIIILPVDHTKDKVKVKSHNKLVDAFACGTMTLCSPQPSYLQFSNYAHVNNDFAESILKCLHDRQNTLERINLAQGFIAQNFTRSILSEKLLEIIRKYQHV